MKHFYLFVAFLTAIGVTAQAQQNSGKLSDLAFIEGRWQAGTAGNSIEGVWLAPKGDNIVGFIRMMKDDKATLFEILAYEQSEQGLVSRVKHFKPGLLGQEEKDKFDQYNFVEAAGNRTIFQKQGEDLRILYEKRSDNQFAISRGSLQDTKWVFKDLFVFNRVK